MITTDMAKTPTEPMPREQTPSCPQCGAAIHTSGQHYWLWNRPADQKGVQFRVLPWECKEGHVWFMEDPPISAEAFGAWIDETNAWERGERDMMPEVIRPSATPPDGPHVGVNVPVGFGDQRAEDNT